jgi:hypothetical protein
MPLQCLALYGLKVTITYSVLMQLAYGDRWTMKWYLKPLLYLSLSLAPVIALAQEDCPAIIQAALEATDKKCATLGRNQACYGNVTLEAQPQPGIDTDELVFEKPGDLVNVADVSSLTLSPWDETQNTWGISLMKLQANLPATLPGQNVTFLLFGNVAIENAVESNAESATGAEAEATSEPSEPLTPMQAFYFLTGSADAPCAEAPDSGILVQTPEGSQHINFTANEVSITLGSTAYLQAQPSGNMTISVVEGQAEVTAQGVTVTVLAGALVEIPLDANRAASGPPGAITPYTGRDVQGLPVGILDRVITVAAPFVEGESTPEATTEVAGNTAQDAPLTAGVWQLTGVASGCSSVTYTFTHNVSFEVDANTNALTLNWNDGVAVQTFDRVENGVYHFDSGAESQQQKTLTILAPDHFTLHETYINNAGVECIFDEDYALQSATS